MAESTVTTPAALAPEKSEVAAPTTREENRYLVPAVDIYENDRGLTVLADMPGVEKSDVEIRVDNGLLTLKGHVHPVAAGTALASEFLLLDYFRQFQLSDAVDVDKISAELKNGVLKVDLPKVEAAKPRQIDVHVG